MSTPTPPSPSTPDPQRRALLAAVGLLLALLIIGGLVVAKSFYPSPSTATATATTARDSAKALEAGLEAAATYQRERKFPEAAAILSKLTEQSPTDQAVRVAYAQALIGLDKHPEAYKQYEAAIALASGDTKTIKPKDFASSSAKPNLKRDPNLAALHFEAGTCASVANLNDRAEEHYWMAQVLDPGEARYPLFLAMVHIKKGDDAAAGADLLRAVKLNPDLAEAWGTMAELELKKNQLGLAAQHIETARKLQPEVARWRLDQARVLLRDNKPEQALPILNSLPTPDRADKSTLALQAECCGLMQKPYQAAALYEAATQQSPTDPELAYQAALWFQRAGDIAKATSYTKTAAMLGHEGAKELLKTLAK